MKSVQMEVRTLGEFFNVNVFAVGLSNMMGKYKDHFSETKKLKRLVSNRNNYEVSHSRDGLQLEMFLLLWFNVGVNNVENVQIVCPHNHPFQFLERGLSDSRFLNLLSL